MPLLGIREQWNRSGMEDLLSVEGNWRKRRVEPVSRMGEIDRRTFVKLSGASAAALVFGAVPKYRQGRRRVRAPGAGALGPRRGRRTGARARILLPLPGRSRPQPGRQNEDRARLGSFPRRDEVRLRFLPAVRARILHGLPSHERGGSRSRRPSRRLHLRVWSQPVRRPWRQRQGSQRTGDHHPLGLPQPLRPVPNRRGPPGGARGLRVGRYLGRPRGRE
jgi:hypothetical protein